MKKLIISLFGFFAISPLTAQERWEYDDFTDGKNVTVNGITYIIENDLQEYANQMERQLIGIRRINEPNEQFEMFGEYPDGTFCNDPEECAGIIRHRQEIPLIIHAAWKKAFPKEERESHPQLLGNMLSSLNILPFSTENCAPTCNSNSIKSGRKNSSEFPDNSESLSKDCRKCRKRNSCCPSPMNRNTRPSTVKTARSSAATAPRR